MLVTGVEMPNVLPVNYLPFLVTNQGTAGGGNTGLFPLKC